jgi:FlgD Ig-like domain
MRSLMMKRIILLILIIGVFAGLQGNFIWEEPVWAIQEYMIHDQNYLVLDNEEGFFLVWVSSNSDLAQIKADKYSWDGEELWGGSRQISDCNSFPSLESGIIDQEGNLIIAYSVLDEVVPLRILKTDQEGELLWDRNFIAITMSLCGVELSCENNDGFYIYMILNDGSSTYYHYFYFLDAEGNITDGWIDGKEVPELRSYCLDGSGNLLYLYCTFYGSDAKVGGYTPEGDALFPSGEILLDDDYENSPFDSTEELRALENGNYLCSTKNKTWLIQSNGEISWEMEKEITYGAEFERLQAGTDCFYEISEEGELYKFNYEPELEWIEEIADNINRIGNIRVMDNSNFRYLFNNYESSQWYYNLQLREYSSEGELISPETGWYNVENMWTNYDYKLVAGEDNSTLWSNLVFNDELDLELSFLIIDQAGEIITGDDLVQVDIGRSKRLNPEAIYVNEENISVLMKDIGFVNETVYDRYLFLQRIDRDGELLEGSAGELILQGELEKIGENENRVIYLERNNNQIHLIDLESGELLWGDSGCNIVFEGEIIEADAEFMDDGVVIFWEDDEGFKFQRFENGIGIWGNGVQVTISDTAKNYVKIEGNFLINIIWGDDRYYISHFNALGQIEWSRYGGFESRGAIGKAYMTVEEGLLYMRRDDEVSFNDINFQLLTGDGDYLYGENGVRFDHIPWEYKVGFIKLDNGYAMISYDYTNELPAKIVSYNMDGSILQPETPLAGTEFCKIVDVTMVDEGLILLITDESEYSRDIYIGYYDLAGNLNSIAGDNPLLAYENFASYTYDMGTFYDDEYFFSWLTSLNYPYHSSASDVFVQGWQIPVVENDENVIENGRLKIENHPNPFNPETTISYQLNQTQPVKLEIYNIKGQHVKTIVNETQEAGFYNIPWKGYDKNNSAVASGVYFYKLTTDDQTQTRKMLLLK